MRMRLVLLLAISAIGMTGNLSAQDSSLLVSDLLKAIQRGVNDANARINKDFHNIPPLESVTLALQTETDINGTGGVNLWFVKFSGGANKTTSTQMTIVLKPATARAPVANKNLDQTISNALYGAAKGIHDAQIGEGALPLLVDSLSADFAFTVKKNGSGGVEFKLLPIGGSLSGGGSVSDVQKMEHSLLSRTTTQPVY